MNTMQSLMMQSLWNVLVIQKYFSTCNYSFIKLRIHILFSGSVLLSTDPRKHRDQYEDLFEKQERIK